MDDRDHNPPAEPTDPPSPHLFARSEAAERPPELELLELLARSRAPLKSLFRSYGIGPDDAEDILQEALLIVVERWRRIDDPPGFFFGTVKNRIQTHLRRLRGERHVLFELGQLEPVEAADYPQQRVDCQEDARRLLARLPEPARRIVEMRYGEQLSSRDVARALGRSDSGVRQIASRALRRLRHDAGAIRSHR